MDFDKEDERMYLQFLQNNIARMNTNSAQAKGWCIAIVAALLAIFAETKNDLFILICLVPIILFCILDALYLQQEHKFVEMYNAYTKDIEHKPNVYEMPMEKYAIGFKGFLKALSSWSVILVYGPLIGTIVLSLFVIKPKLSSCDINSNIMKETNTLLKNNTEYSETVLKSADNF